MARIEEGRHSKYILLVTDENKDEITSDDAPAFDTFLDAWVDALDVMQEGCERYGWNDDTVKDWLVKLAAGEGVDLHDGRFINIIEWNGEGNPLEFAAAWEKPSEVWTHLVYVANDGNEVIEAFGCTGRDAALLDMQDYIKEHAEEYGWQPETVTAALAERESGMVDLRNGRALHLIEWDGQGEPEEAAKEAEKKTVAARV